MVVLNYIWGIGYKIRKNLKRTPNFYFKNWYGCFKLYMGKTDCKMLKLILR